MASHERLKKREKKSRESSGKLCPSYNLKS
jgi:hypothetical protein